MPDSTAHPNIIILYADDLGYGDVGCYGAEEIVTPNVDRLAAEGLKFTDGYASAATCTPSRYSLLTGTYPWRNPAAAILPGDAPMIIQHGTPTLPDMLREAGYRTGVVGKWHLGLGAGDLDWNRDISRTPNHVGFDYAFIMAATNDRVPCVYIENQRVVNLDPADPIEVTYDPAQAFPGVPTGRLNPELLRMQASHGHDGAIVNGVGRIGFLRGGKAALWNDETMAEVFVEKAIHFIEESKDRPFFLYYALHQPHVPRLPGPRFKGVTSLGARGDVIAEMDWCVGQVLEALERLDLRENTIVIFSSDNGPVLDDGYLDRAEELVDGHRPAGPLRGGKYSLFDGGARVPFILRWPGKVQPGESAALVSHLDFYASFAALIGHQLTSEEALDSVDLHQAFFGKSAQGRRELVAEGMWQKTVLRQGSWAYIPAHAGPAVNATTNTELGNSTDPQLYDLSLDIGQITNVAEKYLSRTRRMASRLIKIRESKRTHPRLS